MTNDHEGLRAMYEAAATARRAIDSLLELERSTTRVFLDPREYEDLAYGQTAAGKAERRLKAKLDADTPTGKGSDADADAAIADDHDTDYRALVKALADDATFDGEGWRVTVGGGDSVRRSAGVARWNSNGMYIVEGGAYDTGGERQAYPPFAWVALSELANWLLTVDYAKEGVTNAEDD